jgi:hypothetical protein
MRLITRLVMVLTFVVSAAADAQRHGPRVRGDRGEPLAGWHALGPVLSTTVAVSERAISVPRAAIDVCWQRSNPAFTRDGRR